MKTFALAIGLAACLGPAAGGADDKIDLAGKYTVVGGKKNGAGIDETAKKATYTATADTFTIAGGGQKFVISYKLKPGTKPAEIDMSIAEGPADSGTKGVTAVGIVEQTGDTLKLAYSLDKEKRPKDFDGKTGYYIELKKVK